MSSSFLFVSCGDDEKKEKCLNCIGEDVDQSDALCTGLTDPDSGEKISAADLEALKALLEGFGAECTID